MNDSGPDSRNSQQAPLPTQPVRADGSSSRSKLRTPLADHSTVITNIPPIPSPATPDPAMRLLDGHVVPGDRIGHFDLIEYIGGGGMGRVFRATDTRLGRTVALKVLPPEQAAADAVQRFQNEAQSAARLDHENIARVYYVGEDRGLSFIVFEHVDGLNVRSLVEQKGPLPLAEALSYTIQVAEALSHADERGVVHRDIKPSNVLITPEGRVKLIDMGLARLRNTDPATADLTQSGVTLGTFDYISPEQARDPRNADVRSDIYSLGCTMFFMLAGHPPFPEGTVLQKLLQHQGDQAPDIRQFRPDLPEDVGQTLRHMMAKDPRHRPATSAELVTELLALAEQIGLQPVIPTSRIWLTPPEPSVSFFQRHLPWMAPVAALLCIVFVFDRLSSRDEALPPPLTKTAVATGRDNGKRQKDEPAKSVAEKDSHDSDAAKKDPPGKTATDAAPVGDDVAVKRPDLTLPSPSFFPLDPNLTESVSPFSRAPYSPLPKSPLDEDKTTVPSKATVSKTVDKPKKPQDASKSTRKLIVGDRTSGENEFSTLAAACNAARDGDTIELRFDGPREERPIKLVSNLRLTVQAADGYRPTIVFSPTEINPVLSPSSMFMLAAGQLTLADVSIVFYVPRDVQVDKWAIFETWGGQTIQLDRCSLTVANASNQLATYHQGVAFVRARPSPDSDTTVDGSLAVTPLATLKLTDCVARGEAAFLCVEDLQPIYVLWENGLLATTEQLLAAAGGLAPPKSDEMLRIDLRHVTAVARGGLCRLSAKPTSPYQLMVQVECTDDVIMTSHDAPLIEQEGIASVEKSRALFLWKGDHNYYQDIDVFWKVRNVDSRIAPDAMDFEEWVARWGQSRERQPSRAPLAWRKSPNADQPVHDHTARDYSLEDAKFTETSRGVPGLQADRLPTLPANSPRDRTRPPGASVRGQNADSTGADG